MKILQNRKWRFFNRKLIILGWPGVRGRAGVRWDHRELSLKNDDFLLRNDDFLLKSLAFLLRNDDILLKSLAFMIEKKARRNMAERRKAKRREGGRKSYRLVSEKNGFIFHWRMGSFPFEEWLHFLLKNGFHLCINTTGGRAGARCCGGAMAGKPRPARSSSDGSGSTYCCRRRWRRRWRRRRRGWDGVCRRVVKAVGCASDACLVYFAIQLAWHRISV